MKQLMRNALADQEVLARRIERKPGGGVGPIHVVRTQNDAALAAQGANLLGSLLDVSALDDYALSALLNISAIPKGKQTEAQRAYLSELLRFIPRRSVTGLDVDANGGDVRPIVERLRVALGAHKLEVRESYSSGKPSGGRHMEFSVATEGTVDLNRAMLGWAVGLAREVGLTPRDQHTSTKDGVPLQWTVDGAAGAFLDLQPLNRSPEVKDSLFRPLGGLHKDGESRKTLVPGSPLQGSPITPEMIQRGRAVLREYRDAQRVTEEREREERRAQKQPKAQPEKTSTSGSVSSYMAPLTTRPASSDPTSSKASAKWTSAATEPAAPPPGNLWDDIDGLRHPTRLALAGLLARLVDRGLLSETEAISYAETTARKENGRRHARAVVPEAINRLRNGRACRGLPSLVGLHGEDIVPKVEADLREHLGREVPLGRKRLSATGRHLLPVAQDKRARKILTGTALSQFARAEDCVNGLRSVVRGWEGCGVRVCKRCGPLQVAAEIHDLRCAWRGWGGRYEVTVDNGQGPAPSDALQILTGTKRLIVRRAAGRHANFRGHVVDLETTLRMIRAARLAEHRRQLAALRRDPAQYQVLVDQMHRSRRVRRGSAAPPWASERRAGDYVPAPKKSAPSRWSVSAQRRTRPGAWTLVAKRGDEVQRQRITASDREAARRQAQAWQVKLNAPRQARNLFAQPRGLAFPVTSSTTTTPVEARAPP